VDSRLKRPPYNFKPNCCYQLEDRIKSVTDAFEEQARQSHDVAELRARLEENESVMQQKHGEISHLKHQLKERQIEVTQRTGDVIALRNRNRELQARLRERDVDTAELSAKLEEKDQKMADLGKRLREAEYSLGNLSISGERQKDLDSDPREDLGYSASVERGRDGSSAGACLAGLSRDELLRRLEELELRFEEQGREFEKERRRWAEEKNKVIRFVVCFFLVPQHREVNMTHSVRQLIRQCSEQSQTKRLKKSSCLHRRR